MSALMILVIIVIVIVTLFILYELLDDFIHKPSTQRVIQNDPKLKKLWEEHQKNKDE